MITSLPLQFSPGLLQKPKENKPVTPQTQPSSTPSPIASPTAGAAGNQGGDFTGAPTPVPNATPIVPKQPVVETNTGNNTDKNPIQKTGDWFNENKGYVAVMGTLLAGLAGTFAPGVIKRRKERLSRSQGVVPPKARHQPQIKVAKPTASPLPKNPEVVPPKAPTPNPTLQLDDGEGAEIAAAFAEHNGDLSAAKPTAKATIMPVTESTIPEFTAMDVTTPKTKYHTYSSRVIGSTGEDHLNYKMPRPTLADEAITEAGYEMAKINGFPNPKAKAAAPAAPAKSPEITPDPAAVATPNLSPEAPVEAPVAKKQGFWDGFKGGLFGQ
jgi:hypothetical protein